jgi:hypothetical protein
LNCKVVEGIFFAPKSYCLRTAIEEGKHQIDEENKEKITIKPKGWMKNVMTR